MPLIKLNNRSIKDVTSLPFGVGNLIHIQSQTASNSASISFTTGINSTYKEYQFYFINVRCRTSGVEFHFNMSTNAGSTYVVTKTTTYFLTYLTESNIGGTLLYSTGRDLAQSTNFACLASENNSDADGNTCGTLSLFNPASTTYVKHFISNFNTMHPDPANVNEYSAGYGNTTSAVNAVQFKMSSGNFDGTIAMFGVV